MGRSSSIWVWHMVSQKGTRIRPCHFLIGPSVHGQTYVYMARTWHVALGSIKARYRLTTGVHSFSRSYSPWWRHEIETFSKLLALCAGNSPVTGEFPTQRPVTRSFDVFFDLHLIKRLSKHSLGWWFETLPRSLWRHCNDCTVFTLPIYVCWSYMWQCWPCDWLTIQHEDQPGIVFHPKHTTIHVSSTKLNQYPKLFSYPIYRRSLPWRIDLWFGV